MGGRNQAFCIRICQTAAAGEIFQCRDCIGVQDFRRAVRIAQLQRLGRKLDVDHAAAGIFQIPCIAAGKLRRQLLAHLACIPEQDCRIGWFGQRGVDDRFNLFRKCRGRTNDARAGQRQMFPGPGIVGVIAAEGFQADGNRPFVAGRAEPHVDIVKPTLRGVRRQRRNEPLRQTRIVKWNRQRFFTIRSLHIVGRIVDEDEIEVGACRHFPPAKLAHRNDGKAAAGNTARTLRQFIFNRGKKARQHAIGDMGKSGPRLFRRGGAVDHLNADAKILFAGKTAGEIKRILKIPRTGKRAGQH